MNMSLHTAGEEAEIREIMERLEKLTPPQNIISFNTKEEVQAMTADQAVDVLRLARRNLMFNLLHLEVHEHMGDDCGDDTEAATTGWYAMWNFWFGSDGFFDNNNVEDVRKWLLEEPMGGVDGEIRYRIFSEELIDTLEAEEDARS